MQDSFNFLSSNIAYGIQHKNAPCRQCQHPAYAQMFESTVYLDAEVANPSPCAPWRVQAWRAETILYHVLYNHQTLTLPGPSLRGLRVQSLELPASVASLVSQHMLCPGEPQPLNRLQTSSQKWSNHTSLTRHQQHGRQGAAMILPAHIPPAI